MDISKEVELTDPFVTREFATVVKLYPYQMGNNFYAELKKNVVKKVVNKCNNYGIFTKVIKLTEYEENIINSENFDGNAEYNVKFIATMCIPLINTTIILKYDDFTNLDGVIRLSASNNAIHAILKLVDNSHYFKYTNDKIFIVPYNRFIEKGEYIKATIKAMQITPGDSQISSICKMVGMASPEEVDKWFYKASNVMYEEDIDKEDIALFNDDEIGDDV
jgi:DNA-directed RNA polymerase subunit E'/Rpb7